MPPLPGVTPPTTFVPNDIASSAWNVACWPVKPWMMTFESLSTNTLMPAPPASLAAAHGLGRGVVEVVGLDQREAALVQDRPALLHVRAGQPHDHRHVDRLVARRLHHALRDPVAPVDAGEDVHEDRLHVRVLQHDAERVRDLLGAGAAAHVEEVRRAPAVVHDRVHRPHRQAGAVHDAARPMPSSAM